MISVCSSLSHRRLNLTGIKSGYTCVSETWQAPSPSTRGTKQPTFSNGRSSSEDPWLFGLTDLHICEDYAFALLPLPCFVWECCFRWSLWFGELRWWFVSKHSSPPSPQTTGSCVDCVWLCPVRSWAPWSSIWGSRMRWPRPESAAFRPRSRRCRGPASGTPRSSLRCVHSFWRTGCCSLTCYRCGLQQTWTRSRLTYTIRAKTVCSSTSTCPPRKVRLIKIHYFCIYIPFKSLGLVRFFKCFGKKSLLLKFTGNIPPHCCHNCRLCMKVLSKFVLSNCFVLL